MLWLSKLTRLKTSENTADLGTLYSANNRIVEKAPKVAAKLIPHDPVVDSLGYEFLLLGQAMFVWLFWAALSPNAHGSVKKKGQRITGN